MTEYTREQQGDLTELSGKKIVYCRGWGSRMLELGRTCGDDDAAIIFSDTAAEFDRQAKELVGLLEDGTSDEILAALRRDTVSVLGSNHEYSEAAVFRYRETLAAIFDVEPWARQSDDE